MHSIWVLGDQLSFENSALRQANPKESVVLMIESKAQGAWLRYHQLKLVLVYSAMRHFAESLQQKGWEVDYYALPGIDTFEEALKTHLKKYYPQSIWLTEPNDWPMTQAALKLSKKLNFDLKFLPTKQFLISRQEFKQWADNRNRLLMESHYRQVRKKLKVLLDDQDQPLGGLWNYDHNNRKTYSQWVKEGSPQPATTSFESPDTITKEVISVVKQEFQNHPGDANTFWLPVTRDSALNWLEQFIEKRLPLFGDYEDLMVEGQPILFHSVISPFINLGLLTPQDIIQRIQILSQTKKVPLPSLEGFLRQVIGWREFVNGIYWLRMPKYKELNALEAQRDLPSWFYTGETQMNCLHHCITQVIQLGYNHHIQRLMILGNFLLLAGINPQQAYRWFMEMYVDAFDWVMAANVIGMILHADGGYMATKPYAASASYINKMSNYCANCHYDPKIKIGPKACPFNYLYWNFYDQHQTRFGTNPRVRMMITTWQKKPEIEKNAIRKQAKYFLENL